MNKTVFTIADVCICLQTLYPIKVPEKMQQFLCNQENYDVLYRCVPYQKMIDFSLGKCIYRSLFRTVYLYHDKYYIHIGDRIYIKIKNEQQMIMYIPSEHYQYFCNHGQISSTLLLERNMLLKHQLILHSSVINWQGNGIVFTAPSGTGKSTQADLWKKYENAEIINGDRTIISCHKQECIGYGSPYAGSSGIYKNESVPIKMIVLLEQAKENTMRKVRPKEAFIYLLQQTSNNQWDASFMNELMMMVNEIVMNVPIYKLSCRKDREAVELTKNVLLKNILSLT